MSTQAVANLAMWSLAVTVGLFAGGTFVFAAAGVIWVAAILAVLTTGLVALWDSWWTDYQDDFGEPVPTPEPAPEVPG